MKEKLNKIYNKHYKKILIIPALLIILSLVYLSFFYYQNNDIIYRDVTLTGGTTITLLSNLSPSEVQSALLTQFPDISVTALSDNTGRQTSLLITVPGDSPDLIKSSLETYLDYNLTEQNSSIEFTGSSLGTGFYSQLIKAVIFAFLLMALVVFIVFGESMKIKVYAIILTLIGARITFPLNENNRTKVASNAIIVTGVRRCRNLSRSAWRRAT